jgi:hypothetical protein
MAGVIERVIENWLTSSNERAYQIPFCQLLAAEGETVVYVSPHGPFEQGKDVITVDKVGRTRGYQLKSGDLGLAEWRKYYGEITDLVELPINHPGIHGSPQHIPILVTNGIIKDPAIKALQAANEAWRRRKHPALRTISRGQLLKRFLAVHGSWLPQELSDFTLFMELFLREGTEPLDKDKAAKLLESVLPLAISKKIKTTEIKRSLSSAVLLVGYILDGAYKAENHWAVFEAWVLAAAYVLATAGKTGVAKKEWAGSFELCELGALEALSNLCAECKARDNLVEGDFFTDGYLYRARVTLLVGLVSARSLYHRVKRAEPSEDDFTRDFLKKQTRMAGIWGESAVPYLALAALEMASWGEQALAESLVISIVSAVLEVNGRRDGQPGYPSTYYSAEKALRVVNGLDEPFKEDFVGASYSLYPLIDFLVRRLRRQALRGMWYAITGTHLASFYPSESWEWLRWRGETGALASRFVGSPQSWSALLSDVENIDLSVLPQLLRDNPAFAVLFSLVYPHRFSRELLRLIEDSL